MIYISQYDHLTLLVVQSLSTNAVIIQKK